MDTMIQVGNLDFSVIDRDLRRLFEPHGTVHSARVATHWHSGRSTGVGFVEMESVASGNAAINALNGLTYRGLVLAVCRSGRDLPGRPTGRLRRSK